MEISYNKVWKLLIDKGMNKQDLKKAIVLVKYYSRSI
ncbi:hypothetical protein DFR58_1622 [Anaerobacterium chartisolvens]|uniref:Uncharacterized protein n=1 Tax=Anaerobacterium chartisolvens TaxID=1297424 RepID=A0A369AFE2_9FIRM|nr:hypothetical protein DFR58_1622 [Anaerobacterium chartisolvens]